MDVVMLGKGGGVFGSRRITFRNCRSATSNPDPTQRSSDRRPPPLHVPADRLHNRKRPITFVFPMNLPVASKTKLQFILGLKVKSKLSSVGSESRETARWESSLRLG